MLIPPCSRCGAPSAFTDRATGEDLCPECLLRSIERRARNVVLSTVGRGDRVAVALSGGKDSSLTLFLLKKFSEEIGFELSAITIDEGTAYRRRSIEAARLLASELGVEHVVVPMRDVHGVDAREIASLLPPGWRRSVCTYCGVLRRQAINVVARSIGADWVATGHNLDDVLQTFLMNLIRGDVNALSRLPQGARSPSPLLIPRIRPLSLVREREVTAAVLLLGLPAELGKCPAVSGMRVRVRRAVDDLEVRLPGSKASLWLGASRILPSISSSLRVELKSCRLCGEPCTERLCKACQMKMELEPLLGRKLDYTLGGMAARFNSPHHRRLG